MKSQFSPLLALLFLVPLGQAGASPPAILALYDGSLEHAADETRIHRYAESPLNHLGFELHYWDIRQGLPVFSASCCARVLSWFDAPVPDPGALLDWSEAAARAGARFVVLGETGQAEGDGAADARRMAALDLHWGGSVVATYRSTPAMVGPAYLFEHPLDPVLPPYPVLEPLSPEVEVELSIRDEAPGRRGLTSAVVTSGPHGGYAPTGYVLYVEPELQRVKWLLDPFAFFEAAYGAGLRPVPDVTTLSGRRIYFSQVDGDGWNNVSEVRDANGQAQLSARVLLEGIVDAFPDLPVTLAVIAGDIDPGLGALPGSADIAREAFARPQVEAASHTYTHPFTWLDFAAYSRDAELARVEEVKSRLRATPFDTVRFELASLLGLDAELPDVEHGVAGSAALSRAYFSQPFDLEEEIGGSARAINAILPAGKTVRLLQWSGDAMPFAAAIGEARRHGLPNLNGGDSRFDEVYASTAYLAPISRLVDGERQIYAPAGNEIMYTSDWTGPFDGQAALAQTIARTETPRRLTPIDLYYHAYSAERLASLNTLRDLLTRIDASEVIPVAASTYAGIAEAVFKTTIEPLAPLAWRVRQHGGTVRFDHAAGLSVDFEASSHVIGERRVNGALYVALDTAQSEARLVLTRKPARPIPHLEQSRWQLSDFSREGCGWSARASGFGPGEMSWRGVADLSYRVEARRDGQLLFERTETASGGALAMRIDLDATRPVDLNFACLP